MHTVTLGTSHLLPGGVGKEEAGYILGAGSEFFCDLLGGRGLKNKTNPYNRGVIYFFRHLGAGSEFSFHKNKCLSFRGGGGGGGGGGCLGIWGLGQNSVFIKTNVSAFMGGGGGGGGGCVCVCGGGGGLGIWGLGQNSVFIKTNVSACGGGGGGGGGVSLS